MMLEGLYKFDATPKNLAVGAADQVGSNVFDAGSAVKMFGGFTQKPPVLAVNAKITAGTGALSFRVRFVGADDAVLTGNPEIIADSGVALRENVTGTEAALAIGSQLLFNLSLRGQRMPKRYYGPIYTQGTADQDGEVTAVIVESPQTHDPYRKAAVP